MVATGTPLLVSLEPASILRTPPGNSTRHCHGPITYVELGLRRMARSKTRLVHYLGLKPRPISPRNALSELPASPSILFLCLGNICRSPLAEGYARQRLAEASLDRVTVDSAGTHPETGRRSPKHAVEVANQFDVDLTDHRSRQIEESMLANADLVLVMDVSNYQTLKRSHPDVVSQTYFLKPFGNGTRRDFEIEDPADKSRETFEAVYADVTEAVDGLVDGLRQELSTEPHQIYAREG